MYITKVCFKHRILHVSNVVVWIIYTKDAMCKTVKFDRSVRIIRAKCDLVLDIAFNMREFNSNEGEKSGAK